MLMTAKNHSICLASGSNRADKGGRPLGSLGPVERLSFTESLDSEKFAGAAEATAEELLSAVWRNAFDGATVTLNGVRLLSSRAEMIVTATRNGKALIQSGLATVPRHAASGR